MASSPAKQYETLIYRPRKWVQTVKEEEVPEGMWVHIVHRRDRYLQKLSTAAKGELVKTLLDLTGAPQWLRVWAEARWEAASGNKTPEVIAKTVLMTYNGAFGDLPVEAFCLWWTWTPPAANCAWIQWCGSCGLTS